jgi:iron(II)-dependent oxidoreductase
VGICWFEANAYCRWVGKYLPSSAQWQRAASWHTIKSDGECAQKYPWGDTFDKNLANCWSSGVGQTVPVDHYYNGCTPNGVYQLIGNTWEWLSGRFVETVQPGQKTSGLSEIRGGAFDTYLESQLTCQFRTGQPLLCRSANTGFRCVIGKDQIQSPTPTND